MNCKNCGAPVDGHIACPKCGQLVDFAGQTSYTPRTNYGINWGAEETPVEPVKEAPAQPVVEPKVEVKPEPKVEPVVETKVEEKTVVKEKPVAPKTDYTYKEQEPYTYKKPEAEPYSYKERENKFRSFDFYEANRKLTSRRSSSKFDSEGPLKLAIAFVFILIAAVGGLSELGDNDRKSYDDIQSETQRLYDELDQDTIDRITNFYTNSSSSSDYDAWASAGNRVYATPNGIYGDGGASIELDQDTTVKMSEQRYKAIYIENGSLHLVDGNLEDEVIAENVKDAVINTDGSVVSYITNDGILEDYNGYVNTVAENVEAFVTDIYGSEYLYLTKEASGYVLYNKWRASTYPDKVADGYCTPIYIGDNRSLIYYLDANNNLKGLIRKDEKDFNIKITDQSEYIFSDLGNEFMVNNLAVDGKIYYFEKNMESPVTVDSIGISHAQIRDTNDGVNKGLACTFMCDDGLHRVVYKDNGRVNDELISSDTSIELFETDNYGNCVVYISNDRLYAWTKDEGNVELEFEDVSSITEMKSNNSPYIYYVYGTDLYCIASTTDIEKTSIANDVENMIVYNDDGNQYTLGYTKTDGTENYIFGKKSF